MRRWERARQGQGQLVLIVGEPGLGKSRLIEEFHSRLSDTPHTWVEWTCSQLLQNTPLHPIAEWGRQRFGGADMQAERRLADLENSLAQVKLDPVENASLLAPLLDIPLPRERVSTLAPEELRRRQLAALTNWVMAGARAQPFVLAFEDLHWADPTTLDVLRSIAERGALVPLYIVATTRPEFRPPWGMRSHHGTISLAPLDRAQARDMIGELSARHALSRDVIDDVAARTGGVPLFVEEVTRLLLERGEQGGAQAIPPTLQQSLMARLDRLGPAREVAQYGQWAGSFMRGDYASCRDTAAAFLCDAKGVARMPETAAAHRVLGLMLYLQGEFVEAQPHFVDALGLYDPRWDHDAKVHLGHDTGACATAYLARVNWVLGELGQTRELMDDELARAVNSGHIPTLANTHHHKALFELDRGNTEAVWRDAERVLQLGQQHELPTFVAVGTMLHGYARARLGERNAGVAELRDGLTAYIEQGNKAYVPYYQGLLARLEAEGRDVEGALRRIDEALGLAGATSEHGNDALLHRIRGEILLKRDPANSAPAAEEAFLTAIAIAQQQKAKSFELQAAHLLAKLYQSTGRATDAHAVLAPALEGFSPTPEFPEIAEAQALLTKTAEADEVKNAAASRQRRLKLQTDYGRAMMWSKGYTAHETKVAFARARELCADIKDPAERFPTYYGLWVGSLMRGELASARETANIFLGDAESGAWPTEAAAAHRSLGQTCLWQGDFKEAETHFEEALQIYDPERDREVKFRFGMDTGAGSRALLAVVKWLFGQPARARELIESALAFAAECDHVGTLAPICYHRAELEILSGDADLALRFANTLLELSRERGMPLFLALGAACRGWAKAKLGEADGGLAELRDGLTAFTEQGNRTYVPFLKALLAETEAERQDSERALARIDEALTLVGETGEHWTDAFLHRIRGEILLQRDPANTGPAEEAFLTAIAIAQQQKAKSFELRAGFPLAKLYQSTGRTADAHAVLAPALESFSPTPEFPEIEEAQALLSMLPL